MILVHTTYSTVTQESAAEGEAADSGFLAENVPYSFRELVELIERNGYTMPSSSPATGRVYEWLSGEPVQDYSDGSGTTEAIHYSHDNNPRSARYWRLAFKAVGLLK